MRRHRADDQADAAALGEVAPHGGPGPVGIQPGLESGCPAGSHHGVVIAGRHVPRPQLDLLVPQLAERHLLARSEPVLITDRDLPAFRPDQLLREISRVVGRRGDRQIDLASPQQPRDIGGEHLAGFGRQLRIALAEPVQQRGQRLIRRGERVADAHGARLAPGRLLDPPHGPVGRGEDPTAVGQEHPPRRGQLDAAGSAPEQPHAEPVFQRPDLLADRLLGDEQVVRRPGEAAALRHRDEIPQLAKLRYHLPTVPPGRPSNKPGLLTDNKLRLLIAAPRP